jgi:hypothetical protein
MAGQAPDRYPGSLSVAAAATTEHRYFGFAATAMT